MLILIESLSVYNVLLYETVHVSLFLYLSLTVCLFLKIYFLFQTNNAIICIHALQVCHTIDTRQGEWIGNAYIKTYDVIIDAFFSKNMAASF